VKRGQTVVRIDHDGKVLPTKVTAVFTFNGLDREEVEEVEAGDIVAIAGVGDAGDRRDHRRRGRPAAAATDPRRRPDLRMTFKVNDSPFAGARARSSRAGSSESVYAELERDVALKVEDTETPDTLLVSGRGELHLAILVENMRREGYEFQVSKPEVISKVVNGETQEPYEQLEVEVSQEGLGAVVELVGQRRGILQDMKYRDDGACTASTRSRPAVSSGSVRRSSRTRAARA